MKITDKKIVLNNGYEMPLFGLGTYRMKDEGETKAAIIFALQSGYRHIDTALVYQNQKVVAQAIKESGIDRKEIFVTSKIWISALSKEDALRQFNIIMEELELEYLDLCLVHWYSEFALDIYQALEEVYKEGKVKAIGVSNFMVDQLEEFLPKVEIAPAVNQVELNPLLQHSELIKFSKEKGIVITSYQTLMSGEIGNLPTIVEIAEKYKVSPAQVALKWALSLGVIVIPKSVTNSRIIENMDLDGFELNDQDMKEIAKLDEHKYGNADPYVYPVEYLKTLNK
ncbi:aldo/keto reductase [[Acholeplasma] multilocale]|uniref:aldo/keto reductase n=1 Tax=[Acholeplasma] multilocale TaxID=264638 RepID=UPI0006854CEB|nr:aldo/keto reductase [[Acholeplasma] multilocale]